jgi:hypothetical protein
MRNGIDFSADYRRVLLNDPCVYCGGKPTGLDHIVPRANGGPDGWQNRAPACGGCDGRKAHYGLLRFLATMHGYEPVESTAVVNLVSRRQRRALRPELPPPPPLRVSLGELIGSVAKERCDLEKAA